MCKAGIGDTGIGSTGGVGVLWCCLVLPLCRLWRILLVLMLDVMLLFVGCCTVCWCFLLECLVSLGVCTGELVKLCSVGAKLLVFCCFRRLVAFVSFLKIVPYV